MKISLLRFRQWANNQFSTDVYYDCEDFYNGAVYDQETLKKMIEFFESLDYKYHYLGHADVETKEFALNRLKAELK